METRATQHKQPELDASLKSAPVYVKFGSVDLFAGFVNLLKLSGRLKLGLGRGGTSW
ncbi:MAG: hypothetical protein NTW03_08685 [Verrucomicrobia bacterium]|nr:hypothetical protein [Verrucomicrobiota bacterium]